MVIGSKTTVPYILPPEDNDEQDVDRTGAWDRRCTVHARCRERQSEEGYLNRLSALFRKVPSGPHFDLSRSAY
jgi:hypothetical protein